MPEADHIGRRAEAAQAQSVVGLESPGFRIWAKDFEAGWDATMASLPVDASTLTFLQTPEGCKKFVAGISDPEGGDIVE